MKEEYLKENTQDLCMSTDHDADPGLSQEKMGVRAATNYTIICYIQEDRSFMYPYKYLMESEEQAEKCLRKSIIQRLIVRHLAPNYEMAEKVYTRAERLRHDFIGPNLAEIQNNTILSVGYKQATIFYGNGKEEHLEIMPIPKTRLS